MYLYGVIVFSHKLPLVTQLVEATSRRESIRSLCTCFQNASSLIFVMKKFVLYLVFICIFSGGKFLHLGDQKVGSSNATRTFSFFLKKLGTSCHITREKILKSPHLDNRFQHVTNNIRGVLATIKITQSSFLHFFGTL